MFWGELKVIHEFLSAWSGGLALLTPSLFKGPMYIKINGDSLFKIIDFDSDIPQFTIGCIKTVSLVSDKLVRLSSSKK